MEDVAEWERNLQGAVTWYRLISKGGNSTTYRMSQEMVCSAVRNYTFLLPNSTKRRLLSALPKQKRLSYGLILMTATQSLGSAISIMLI